MHKSVLRVVGLLREVVLIKIILYRGQHSRSQVLFEGQLAQSPRLYAILLLLLFRTFIDIHVIPTQAMIHRV